MGSHKAAKRYDRGFAAPFLVTKAHIDMPFSYLLDSLYRKPGFREGPYSDTYGTLAQIRRLRGSPFGIRPFD